MKKLQTQTGLVKSDENAKARARKESGKTSNKKAAKQRKQQKLAEKKEQKKRKQGGPGRPFRAKPWADYAQGEKPVKAYSTEQLRDINRRAAKAANSRLRALEKAGQTKWAYNMAARLTGKEKPRFTESQKAIAKMSRQQLEKQFYNLREYMTAKTSTLQGLRAHEQKVLNMAREEGFEGTTEELSALFEKYMTAEWEKILGSPLIRGEILSGRAAHGSLEYLREKQERASEMGRLYDEDKQQGALLLESLRKFGG